MMTTYGGERVTLSTGAPSLHTIGVSLGRIARFCGHTRDFYPVLGHVLTVAAIVEPKYGLYALLHDAPEVLVSDVPTPMKTQVARNREARLLKRIYEDNFIPWPISDEAQDAIDEADHVALIAEAHVLGHPGEWGVEYDEKAARLTLEHLALVPKYLRASYAGPKFVDAFWEYFQA